ncbi:phosphatidylglycerol lysyltransferase domain-containing protein [Ruminococcaceae bacterium OttesenSCG-928-I18]|nr:phosphatidylglycerol lysyltransferase domain-containing protein [Ruminococcaceae bacterium OttesenSCG-928-I18]
MIFNEVKIEDAKWAVPLLESNGYRSCEFAFVNLYIWKKVYHTEIARFEDYIVVRYDYGDEYVHYQFPCGTGDLKAVLEAVLQDAKTLGKIPVISTIPKERLPDMEELFPGYFRYDNPPGQSDYVYLQSDLANLPGRKYQKKRNHCSKFERTYPDWQFREIGDDSIHCVCEFNDRWANLYDNRDDEGIMTERRAIEQACRHYSEMNVKGGYIRVDGEVVAFSFGSKLGSDMFVTHVEKALYDVSGAYAMINREMARFLGEGYRYINRENDLDEEGLREAKLSYHPHFRVDKYDATPIDWQG